MAVEWEAAASEHLPDQLLVAAELHLSGAKRLEHKACAVQDLTAAMGHSSLAHANEHRDGCVSAAS